MRLLPKNSEVGWTPYLWLIYLTPLFIRPVITESASDWALAFLGVVVFLPLYFRGFWVRGKELLLIIAAIVLLGVLYAPWNTGGAAFFIYAAAFLGRIGNTAKAVRYLAIIVGVVVATTLAIGMPNYGWIPAIVFSIIIGAVNIHCGEVSRSNVKLRLAQEEVERLATLAERERIARDLHDLLGHTLSVVTLKSELASKLVGTDPGRAVREIREVEAISREALSEVRKTVAGYRHLKIGAELAKAKVALGSAGIKLEVDRGPYSLEPFAESAVALALREAVTNVVRHAGADTCRIELSQADGEFRLAVADDGKGGEWTEGGGLSGMRERLTSVGGAVEIDGSRGTRVSVTLPSAARPLGEVSATA